MTSAFRVYRLVCDIRIWYFLPLIGIVNWRGWPVDDSALALLCAAIAIGIMPWCAWWNSYLLTLGFLSLFYILVADALGLPGTKTIIDECSGQIGLEVWPGFRFGRKGPNSNLIYSRLGERTPCWKSWEPIHGRSLIFLPSLQRILEILPPDATDLILLSLTDRKNILRVHQNLILGYIGAIGFSAENESQAWWIKNRDFLLPEYDSKGAAEKIFMRDTIRSIRELMMVHLRAGALNSGAEEDLIFLIKSAEDHEYGRSVGDDGDFVEHLHRLRQIQSMVFMKNPICQLAEKQWGRVSLSTADLLVQ